MKELSCILDEGKTEGPGFLSAVLLCQMKMEEQLQGSISISQQTRSYVQKIRGCRNPVWFPRCLAKC